MTDQTKRVLVHELALPLAHSWWTLVAGVCVGLAAGLLAHEYAPRFGAPGVGLIEVCLLGIVIGLIVFAGPVLVRSAVDPLVRNEDVVRSLTDVPVLGTIPRIRTPETLGESRRHTWANVGLAGVAATVLAAVVAALAM